MYLKELASVANNSHLSKNERESSHKAETSLADSHASEDEAVGMTLWKREENFAMISELSFDMSGSTLAHIDEDECSIPEAPSMERFRLDAHRDCSPKIPHKQSSIASLELREAEMENDEKDRPPRLSRHENTLQEGASCPSKEDLLFRDSLKSCDTKITVLSAISEMCTTGPSPDLPPKMAVRMDSTDLCAIFEPTTNGSEDKR